MPKEIHTYAHSASHESLVELGHDWEEHGLYRVYFEPLTGWYGLRPVREKLQLVGYSFRGQPCDSTVARPIIDRLKESRVYYNVLAQEFCGESIGYHDFEEIVNHIIAALAMKDRVKS